MTAQTESAGRPGSQVRTLCTKTIVVLVVLIVIHGTATGLTMAASGSAVGTANHGPPGDVTTTLDSDESGSATATSLSIALQTTRGDDLTGGPLTWWYARGQDIRVVIEYSGLSQDGGTIEVVDHDPIVADNEFTRVTVPDTSGVVNVTIPYEELDRVANEFGESGGPDLEARWVRSGAVEETSNRMTVAETETTIYVSEFPSSVAAGESASVGVYGWSRYDFINAELDRDCGFGCLETIANNPDISANPAFEGTLTFTPSEHVSVGESARLRADGSKDFTPETRWFSIQVAPNDPPTADAGDDRTVAVGESVPFDASGSTDSDGSLTDFSWEFGDGATAAGQQVTHTYDSAGTYTVSLTVRDDQGATDTDTATVTVESTDQQPETEVSVTGSERIGVGTTRTLGVVVDNGVSGVQGYTLSLDLSDTSAAKIVGVSPVGEPSVNDTSVTTGGDAASMRVGYLTDPLAGSNDLTVATITVEGTAVGSTEVLIEAVSVSTEENQQYRVTGTNGLAVSVVEGVTVTIPGAAGPATDPDGDGLFEDVTGDGSTNIFDAIALYNNRNSDAVRNNADMFNFDGSGEITLFDAIALYNEMAG